MKVQELVLVTIMQGHINSFQRSTDTHGQGIIRITLYTFIAFIVSVWDALGLGLEGSEVIF